MGNRMQFPPTEGPLDDTWTSPLDMVRRALLGAGRRHSDQFLDVADFMIMGRLVRPGRPDIVLYKHRFTRRYLNIDPDGHTYRYHPPRRLHSNHLGSYRPHRSLRAAVDHLGLRDLPWMKSGLEHHRCGVGWDERWSIFDDDRVQAFPGAPPPDDR